MKKLKPISKKDAIPLKKFLQFVINNIDKGRVARLFIAGAYIEDNTGFASASDPHGDIGLDIANAVIKIANDGHANILKDVARPLVISDMDRMINNVIANSEFITKPAKAKKNSRKR
jgi:hypothetical protein